MLHPRIKRELLRSIGIFGFAMFLFLFISINSNDYYWTIIIGPILAVIIYMLVIITLVKKKEPISKNIILESHRTIVGSVVFLFFLTYALPYLIFLTELNKFSILISIVFVFFFGLSIILVYSNNKKIENATKNNRKILKIQRKLAKQEILLGGSLIYILGASTIIYPSFGFMLWIIPLIAIPAGLAIELFDKKLYFEIDR